MRINSPYITGSATITGNLCVQGTISGTISTASYADTLDGLDSTQFVQTGSFNSYTSSASSSIGSLSGSVATTTSGLSSSIGSLSSSVATTTSGLSSSVATTTSGLGGRITTIEGRYATTGSNIFVGSQVITGSLYITNDMIVQGCSCLQNITASAVSIGTNTVVLNTATPAVRFAGVSVQDSGSNAGVTGSIFWDGLCNRWVYSNPSGIEYSGGMLLSGPRTSTLGTESPLTCNYIAKSGGGDHLYDSIISETGSAISVAGTISSTDGTNISTLANNYLRYNGGDFYVDACVVGGNFRIRTSNVSALDNTALFICGKNSNVGIGTATPSYKLDVNGSFSFTTGGNYLQYNSGILYHGNYYQYPSGNDYLLFARSSGGLNFGTNDTQRLSITSAGIACFAGTVCTSAGLVSGCGDLTVDPVGKCVTIGRISGVSGDNSTFVVRDRTDALRAVIPGGGSINTIFRTNASCVIVQNYSGTDMFRVANDGTSYFSGYVGIGASTPLTKLHLYDSSPNYILLTNTGADGVSNAIQGGIIGQSRGYSNNLAQMASILFRNKNTAAWYKGEITFSTNDSDGTNPAISPVERMRISSDGNIGIGTSCPIASLHICASDGHLRLSGDGRAQMILGTSTKSWQFETSCGTGNVQAGAIGIVEAGSGSRFQILSGGISCFSNTVCAPIVARCGSKWQLNGSIDGGNNACALVINIDNSRAVRVRGIVTGIGGQTMTSLGMYEAIVYRLGGGAGNESKRFAVLVDCNASPGNGQGIKMDVVGDTLYIQNKTSMSYSQSIVAWAEIFYA